MIVHKHKIIFIHIPKTAGSSIEKFFGIDKISHKWDRSNRLFLKGWDPVHKIHLQHAKALDLLDKKLILQDVWYEYFKFAFVRNPWDRAHSDYLWMKGDRKIEGSFEDYILKKGVFEKHLTNLDSMHTRGDHVFPQNEFVYDEKGNCLVNFVGKFENLQADFRKVCSMAGVEYKELPHEKKSKFLKPSYREFYDQSKKDLVADVYSKDIELFDYQF